MKSAFQKVSAITVAVVALVLVPATAGTASAEEPGQHSPVTRVGEIVTEVPGEPGWQVPPVNSAE
ncbi:hypothetical protein ACFPH6_06985 [Streptomyces xiangluensis]|uniref:Secreted protein n=1 Tax=Streptomyces xiangluensis TaxID=2665720 RepID=A0ABV8YIE2_9ACTN